MGFIEIQDMLINANHILSVKKDETYKEERSNIPKVYKLIVNMIDIGFYEFYFADEKERDSNYYNIQRLK